MTDVHFTNLLIVVTVALLAPLTLGFFPRPRLPAIVLEIVLGIVIGPSGLGWVTPDLPVSILALVGLSFLLFLSGLEIDIERLRGAWQEAVFALYLAEGKIEPQVVENMRCRIAVGVEKKHLAAHFVDRN